MVILYIYLASLHRTLQANPCVDRSQEGFLRWLESRKPCKPNLSADRFDKLSTESDPHWMWLAKLPPCVILKAICAGPDCETTLAPCTSLALHAGCVRRYRIRISTDSTMHRSHTNYMRAHAHNTSSRAAILSLSERALFSKPRQRSRSMPPAVVVAEQQVRFI